MGELKINLNAIKEWAEVTKAPQTTTPNATDIPKNQEENNTPSPEKSEWELSSWIKLNINSIKTSGIKTPNKSQIEWAKQDKNSINKKEENEKEINQNLFTNYESVFKKEKKNILERIKKLKTLPTTNIIFITILVWLTIGWIWLLFHVNPETHNIDNYKTSIKDTYNALTGEEEIIDTGSKQEKIDKWWYVFNIVIENINWKEVYVYNWKYYESKKDLDKLINNEIEERKKQRVIKTLKSSFEK